MRIGEIQRRYKGISRQLLSKRASNCMLHLNFSRSDWGFLSVRSCCFQPSSESDKSSHPQSQLSTTTARPFIRNLTLSFCWRGCIRHSVRLIPVADLVSACIIPGPVENSQTALRHCFSMLPPQFIPPGWLNNRKSPCACGS